MHMNGTVSINTSKLLVYRRYTGTVITEEIIPEVLLCIKILLFRLWLLVHFYKFLSLLYLFIDNLFYHCCRSDYFSPFLSVLCHFLRFYSVKPFFSSVRGMLAFHLHVASSSSFSVVLISHIILAGLLSFIMFTCLEKHGCSVSICSTIFLLPSKILWQVQALFCLSLLPLLFSSKFSFRVPLIFLWAFHLKPKIHIRTSTLVLHIFSHLLSLLIFSYWRKRRIFIISSCRFTNTVRYLSL